MRYDAAGRLGLLLGRRSPRLPCLGPLDCLDHLGRRSARYPALLWLDPTGHLQRGLWCIRHWRRTAAWAAAIALLTVFILSLLWPGAWCAKLCPLGALHDLLFHLPRSIRPSHPRNAVAPRQHRRRFLRIVLGQCCRTGPGASLAIGGKRNTATAASARRAGRGNLPWPVYPLWQLYSRLPQPHHKSRQWRSGHCGPVGAAALVPRRLLPRRLHCLHRGLPERRTGRPIARTEAANKDRSAAGRYGRCACWAKIANVRRAEMAVHIRPLPWCSPKQRTRLPLRSIPADVQAAGLRGSLSNQTCQSDPCIPVVAAALGLTARGPNRSLYSVCVGRACCAPPNFSLPRS